MRGPFAIKYHQQKTSYMVVLLQIIPGFPDSQPQIGVEEFLSLPQFIHALLMQIQINPVSMRIQFNFFDQLS